MSLRKVPGGFGVDKCEAALLGIWAAGFARASDLQRERHLEAWALSEAPEGQRKGTAPNYEARGYF